MNHEKLICYRNLIRLVEELTQETCRWPRRRDYLCDQLNRALSSSILNLAEGNGKVGYPKERRRFFEIALGSISETAACLDLAKVYRLIPQNHVDVFKNQLRLIYHQIRHLP